jgi:S1-C subfamily serine protease
MNDLVRPISQVSESICAVMRIMALQTRKSKGQSKTQFRLAFVGSAWCIVSDRYLLTAHHVFNDGKPRDPNDKFFVFTVPLNGPAADHFPVIGYPLEDAKTDTAILEIQAPSAGGQHIPSAPITFAKPADGTKVLTIGFPAPEIQGADVGPNGDFLGGGQFFLKSHANEGIVAAQYEINSLWYFEFNVGWHHGESGGPVLQADPVAAFSIMQHYRNIHTHLGIFPGPHRGVSLQSIQNELTSIGAKII